MKKLDKLLIKSFIGPLILTFCVSVFILLIQYMLKYFDDLVGKDLGYTVFAELILYFSINMTPIALPLAILIASIMTYGNLGEHFELTAIKGSGISLTRTLMPVGILVFIISVGAFFSNNYIVPNANLRAYSLLYDIKHKKPSLDLQEGQFYQGIPDYSIKVKKKHKDGISISDIIIYDHKGSSRGNKKVIVADSCRMYTIINDRYLMMELFNGNHYIEGENKKKRGANKIETFTKTEFKTMKMVFSLSSFDLDRTDMDLFKGNRLMKSSDKISHDIDSLVNSTLSTQYQVFQSASAAFKYHFNENLDIPEKMKVAFDVVARKNQIRDSLKSAKEEQKRKHLEDSIKKVRSKEKLLAQLDSAKLDSIATQPELVLTNETDSTELASSETSNEPSPRAKKERRKNRRTVIDPDPSARKLIATNGNSNFRKLTNTNNESKNIQKDSLKKLTKTGSTSQVKNVGNGNNKYESYKDIIKRQERINATVQATKVQDTTFIQSDSALVAARKLLESSSGSGDQLKNIYTRAVGTARTFKTNMNSKNARLVVLKRVTNEHRLEKNKKLSQAMACFIMFLIGAPLGAIIKKGGLGMPVVVSTFFFIIFYVLSVIAEKWAKADVMNGYDAAWIPDIVLLPFGLIFLYQARRDAKLFDADFYTVWFQNLQQWWSRKMSKKRSTITN